jgi:transforming growth factor-beta-induced protein
MDRHRLGIRSVVSIALALAVFPACGDDDTTTEDPVVDAGGSKDSGAPADSGTRASVDSGAATPVVDSGRADTGTPSSTADAAAQAADAGAVAKTIVELAVADGRFKTLAKALTDTDLVATLSGAGPLTVFAPTDAAFAALPAGTLEALTKEQLATILKYHVIGKELPSSALSAGPVKTAADLSAFVAIAGSTVKVNDATVTTADVDASNGVIHVIDKVLLPPNLVEAAGYAGFSKLLAAATRAGLASTLSAPTANLTVLAPTDAAFTTLGQATVDGLSTTQLADVLKYHVVSGKVLSTALTAGPVPSLLTGKNLTISLTGGVKVNDANVVIADVLTTNGIIHVIDKVLLPPS